MEREQLQLMAVLVNSGKESAKVSLLLTWPNSIGGVSHLSGDHVNEPFITAKENPPVTFAITACETQNVSVTVLPRFGLSEGSCISAKDMWGQMVQDGHFDPENSNAGPSMPSSAGGTHCAAVSASAWVEPHGKCTVAFALAWSSPRVKFSKGKSYHRNLLSHTSAQEKRIKIGTDMIGAVSRSSQQLSTTIASFVIIKYFSNDSLRLLFA
ncbi:hypothetical protein RJ640_015789 [Escallonia rubra]|uniref:Glycosyl-hydrolase family 116 N-terminal domain-containing protein n=1 Tax=Escallonia rubra TaxID=112253 RepID=A0AA88UN05_9ASTE|nr:hypothetical protein RJ640_015789 [Escallonia rubra]